MANKQLKNSPVIEIDGLSKTYAGNQVPALDNLSITINRGEVYGFLGPNGAGKSTTIRTLLNFLQPTGGIATIGGYDIIKDSLQIRKSVGYLTGDLAMYPKMTAKQYLSYLCELQGGSGKDNIAPLTKRLDAELDKRLGDLSRGNRQKIAIIQAFMHSPDVFILDEPTSGLDPLAQDTFQALILEAKKRGATVFMSSHVLSEVQKMCDRVGIIKAGRLVSESNISDLAIESAHTFDITFRGNPPLEEIKRLNGAQLASHDGSQVTLHMHGSLSALFALLAKHDVNKIEAGHLDLEETFMQFYKDEEAGS